jgi:hypothetical protein
MHATCPNHPILNINSLCKNTEHCNVTVSVSCCHRSASDCQHFVSTEFLCLCVMLQGVVSLFLSFVPSGCVSIA